MICKYCGSEIEDDSTFCGQCGKAQHAERNAETQKGTKKGAKTKYIMIAAGAILCVVIAVVVVMKSMTNIEIVNDSVEAGSIVNTKDIVKAKSGSATVSLEGEIDTSKLGNQEIKCKISNGIFHSEKKISVAVVDTTCPTIEGPESITVIAGQEFNVSDYFTVNDFDKNLADNLKMDPELDTSKEGTQEVVVSATDSSGNTGELPVEIKVRKLSVNEQKVLQAINQYVADGKSKDDILQAAWIMKTSGGSNGVEYYVEVANNVLYAIEYSGAVSEFTALDCGGSTMYDLVVYAVHYNGTTVSTAKLLK